MFTYRLFKPIRDSQLTRMPHVQKVDQRLARLFPSLLMALAFCLQTRVDLAIYIVALQRHAQEPTVEHIRKLNAIVLLRNQASAPADVSFHALRLET